jgi:EH_Signature domain
VSLRDALEIAAGPGSRPRFAPPTHRLPEIVRGLVARYGSSEAPRRSPAQLAGLLQRLREAQFQWEKVGAADRLDVAWVLWSGAEKPAEQPNFLRGFLAWIEKPWRRVQARRLAIAWAEAADPALASIGIVGDFLAARAARLGPPWSALASEFDIFTLARGPAKLAEAYLASGAGAETFLTGIALAGNAASGGLLLETLAAGAARVAARLAKRPELAAALIALAVHRGIFRPAALARENPGRAGSVARAVAEALLLPWEHGEPPAMVRSEIADCLLRHYGDARIREAIWARLRPPARDIARRWLTERTIDTFFGLAGGGAEGLRFWSAYGADVEDAWLLAGSATAARLKTMRLGHGRVAGCRPDFCVLLLGIRGLTVARTNNEGAWHAWLPHNNLAPPLYGGRAEPCYPASLANGADFSPEFGRRDDRLWQDGLHDFIKAHTGISVPRHAYLG